MKKLRNLMFLVLMAVLLIPSHANAATGTTFTEQDAWLETGTNAFRKGTEFAIDDKYSTIVIVQLALNSATAHEGTIIKVQAATSPTSATGDEDWADIHSGTYLIDTANLETITNNPATAGTTVFTVASTTDYDVDGIQFVFIEDATIANSEVLQAVSHVTDTSVTMLDGSTHEHANTAVLSDKVAIIKVIIPMGYQRGRVITDNTLDSDGTASTVVSRTTTSTVDSIQ